MKVFHCLLRRISQSKKLIEYKHHGTPHWAMTSAYIVIVSSLGCLVAGRHCHCKSHLLEPGATGTVAWEGNEADGKCLDPLTWTAE